MLDPNKIIEYLLQFDGLHYQRAANINYTWEIFSNGKVTRQYLYDGSDGYWRVKQSNGIYTSSAGTFLVIACPISGISINQNIFTSPYRGVYIINKTTSGESQL